MLLKSFRRGLGAPVLTGPILTPSMLTIAGPYLAAAFACLAILVVVLRLDRADLRSPLQNVGDAIVSQLVVRNVLDTGWYTTSERGGAPYGIELYDFPIAEGLHLTILRGLGLFSRNVYRVVNGFFLLSFVLSTLTTVFALRWLGVRAVPAIVGGLLFAFLPFHFWRFEAHLFLAAYYTIPPAILVAVWLTSGQLGAAAPGDEWRRRRLVTALLTAAAVSSSGAYYAFFACYFFAVGGLAGFCRTGRGRVLAVAAGLIGITFAGFFANVYPTIRYARENGPNLSVASRQPFEAEYFGLNLTQLLLPRTGHRSEWVREIKAKFTNAPSRPLPNDFGSSVGAVGVVGLAAALATVLFRRVGGGHPALADLGALAICGILLGTICGLGSLFAFFVSPSIRCYDRISIFLGFCALSASALLLNRLLDVLACGWRRAVGYVVCLAVLAFGLWDQTSPLDVPNHEAQREETRNIARFVGRIEAEQPPGGMVFQLPYSSFPESLGVHAMCCYDHLRLIMPARTVRFSSGRMRGRPGDDTLAQVGALPPERQLDSLAYMGFTGLHIDRRGYPDGGREVVAKFQALLGCPPLECGNGRDLFFSLVRHRERLLSGLSREEVASLEYKSRWPFRVTWQRPFDPQEEIPGGKRWRWCQGPIGEIEVENPRHEPMVVDLSFSVAVPSQKLANVTVTGLVSLDVPVAGETPCSARVEVAPGRHRLIFACPVEPLRTPGRDIFFGVIDFRARVENEHPLLVRIKGKDGEKY
jgi:phosphoglycerol transferase